MEPLVYEKSPFPFTESHGYNSSALHAWLMSYQVK